jgi:hypothetical protein
MRDEFEGRDRGNCLKRIRKQRITSIRIANVLDEI